MNLGALVTVADHTSPRPTPSPRIARLERLVSYATYAFVAAAALAAVLA